jgi:hypothetical protein
MTKLLSPLERGAAPDEEEMSAVLTEVGSLAPADYVEALREASGYTGFLSDVSPYVELWPFGRLTDINREYGVMPKRDGMLLIGSDGGGTAYAVVAVGDRLSFADVPFIPLKVGEATLRGDSFEEFLDELRQGGHIRTK